MKSKYVLTGIILITIFFRLWMIGGVPPSASLDEASIGYNAYSILNTGRDEYGNFLPLLLRAYDDWRPALYVYLVIPFIKIFGLNVFSVRLPSVVLSVFTVLAVYFLVKDLFKSHSYKWLKTNYLALLVTFSLAISPWHIYISRLGHEVNAGFAFFVFGLLFFFKERFGLSIFLFLLSFISYQSEKVFLPLIILVLIFLYKEKIQTKIRNIVPFIVIAFIILVPFLNATFSPGALIRLQGTNIFSAEHKKFEESTKKLLMAKQTHDMVGQLLYNRRVIASEIVFNSYVSHFNPKWLVRNSGNEDFKVPNIGLLYIWEFPFILIGITLLLFGKFSTKVKIVIFSWFLISPISSSFTTDAPHAMRAFTFLPTWQIFSSLGLLYFFTLVPKYVKLLAAGIFLCLLLYSLNLLFVNYFFVFPKEQSRSFQCALSRAIPFVENEGKQYNKIIFSNFDNLYQSYMFFLYYSKYDPKLYLSQGGTRSGGYKEPHAFGKFEFRPIVWNKEKKKDTLFVGNPNDFPNNIQPVFNAYYLDGSKGISIVNP